MEPLITCSKHVGGLCGEPATEIILAKHADGNGMVWWEGRGRCKGHPAAGDVAMIRRVDPSAEIAVLPVL